MGNLTRSTKRSLVQILVSKSHALPSDKTGQGSSLDCREDGRLEDFDLQSEKTWAFFKGTYGGDDGPTRPGAKGFWYGAFVKPN